MILLHAVPSPLIAVLVSVNVAAIIEQTVTIDFDQEPVGHLTDGFVEVTSKPISGKEDQAGGLIWRAKDANNYYVTRANALEDNVTIYHTINGRRTEQKLTKMKVAPNAWHRLRVDFEGTHFTVRFDGQTALDWEDATFKEAGNVGVWTKADSVTLFDNFRDGTK